MKAFVTIEGTIEMDDDLIQSYIDEGMTKEEAMQEYLITEYDDYGVSVMNVKDFYASEYK